MLTKKLRTSMKAGNTESIRNFANTPGLTPIFGKSQLVQVSMFSQPFATATGLFRGWSPNELTTTRNTDLECGGFHDRHATNGSSPRQRLSSQSEGRSTSNANAWLFRHRRSRQSSALANTGFGKKGLVPKFTQTLSSSAPSCSTDHSPSQTPSRSETNHPRCSIPPSSPSESQFPLPPSPPARYEISPPPPPPAHRPATSNPRRSTPESSPLASRSTPQSAKQRKTPRTSRSLRQSPEYLPADSSTPSPRCLAAAATPPAPKSAHKSRSSSRCPHPHPNTTARSKCSPPATAACPPQTRRANNPK